MKTRQGGRLREEHSTMPETTTENDGTTTSDDALPPGNDEANEILGATPLGFQPTTGPT